MFRRLDVRLIVMVSIVVVVAVGMTLYLIWWIDANRITTVTPGATGNGFNVTEETLSVGEIVDRNWPVLLLVVSGTALLQTVVQAMKPQLSAAGQQVRLELGDLPLIRADEKRMHQVRGRYSLFQVCTDMRDA